MKKLLARLKKDQRGLTLVELLAVVVILAIVSGIAFVVIGNVIENSKKDAHIANAQQMISAAKLYETSGNEIPATGVELATLLSEGNISTMTDPWDKEPYASGTVKKVSNEYQAVLTLKTTANDKCVLKENVTESDLHKGRKTACTK